MCCCSPIVIPLALVTLQTLLGVWMGNAAWPKALSNPANSIHLLQISRCRSITNQSLWKVHSYLLFSGYASYHSTETELL